MSTSKSEIPDHVPEELVFDYDFIADPAFEKDPINAQSELLKDAPVISYSTRHGGHWTVKDIDFIRSVSQQPESFSSFPAAIPSLKGQSHKLPPLELDPPELNRYRFAIAPALAPPKAKALESTIREYTINHIDAFAARGKVDFVNEFATILPVQIFLLLIGVPEDRLSEIKPLNDAFLNGADDPVAAMEAGQKLQTLYAGIVQERKSNLGDDLVSLYLKADPAGGKFSDEEVTAAVFTLFIAGIDTVASSLGLTWKILADNPDMQRTIRENPDIIPTAFDEFMRYTSLISTARTVTHDLDFNGVKMKKGDRVLLPLNYANRHTNEIEEPHKIDLHRTANNHVAFGAGPHRCIGSHVARTELRVVMEEWFKRIPEFSIDARQPVVGRGGHGLRLNNLPLEWAIS